MYTEILPHNLTFQMRSRTERCRRVAKSALFRCAVALFASAVCACEDASAPGEGSANQSSNKTSDKADDYYGFSDPWPFTDAQFENLDYGIYWFNSQGDARKAGEPADNEFFDPGRPTILYVHGWMPDHTLKLKRDRLTWPDSEASELFLGKAWIKAGWNVGVFYWNQFADESEMKDAEAKIWTAQGPRGMRWRSANGQYDDSDLDVSVSDLFFEAYRDALVGFSGGEIRIAGHSLGAQLVLTIADLARTVAAEGEIAAELVPQRLALLDPAFSKGAKPYLEGTWTGEKSREIAAKLIESGVLLEAYRGSGATSTGFFGDANTALFNMSALTELKPWFFGWFQVNKKHIVPAWTYFWSIQFPPPEIDDSDEPGASASTPGARIKELMNSRYKLVQSEGTDTKTPADDTMRFESR